MMPRRTEFRFSCAVGKLPRTFQIRGRPRIKRAWGNNLSASAFQSARPLDLHAAQRERAL